MKISRLDIPDVLLIEPQVFHDERGFFYESFNEAAFAREAGITARFVQENYSHSRKNVVRGLHYQIEQAQGKLVRVAVGEIFDVVVDIRRRSPTFGRWAGCRLRAEDSCTLWVPAGFAHGFVALTDVAGVSYKVTDYWAPRHERRIVWNDPDLKIDWPLDGEPILSASDATVTLFRDAAVFE